MTNLSEALLMVVIFWMLTTPHEYAHAWVATRLGDDTPEREGRVTLNPLAHVDWMGTVFLPAVTALMGGGFLGWGRAVNTNPSKLRFGNIGLALVALAGPASNILFALLIAGIITFFPPLQSAGFLAMYISLYLAIFNMLPVPPLDGSKLLIAANVPGRIYNEIARFGFLLVLVLMFSTSLGSWMSNWSRETALAMLGLFRR